MVIRDVNGCLQSALAPVLIDKRAAPISRRLNCIRLMGLKHRIPDRIGQPDINGCCHGISSGMFRAAMDIPSGSCDTLARLQPYLERRITFRQVGNSAYTIANLNSGKLS